MLQALAERRIGRRDQAQAWLWRLAEYSRDVHEEYAVQRWPETKRLLGLLVNSSGAAHGRNARRLVHASRKHDRRLAAALLAAALGHTPGGRGGPARRAQPHGAQAVGARARAGTQLPEGQAQAQEPRRAAARRARPPQNGRVKATAAERARGDRLARDRRADRSQQSSRTPACRSSTPTTSNASTAIQTPDCRFRASAHQVHLARRRASGARRRP